MSVTRYEIQTVASTVVSRMKGNKNSMSVIADPLMFPGADPELIDKFERFHNRNPAIYEAFDHFTREAKASGKEKFSHWLIANRIRWLTEIETQGSAFKVSNDFIALYARMFVALNPDFDGFFEFKKMKAVRKGSSAYLAERELGNV